MLCNPDYHPESYQPTEFVKSSFLYRTAPMYLTDQPSFWNGAVQLETDLDPHHLLRRLKDIEADMGRNLSSQVPRNGPRPLDLDILLYYNNSKDEERTDQQYMIVNTDDLIVPHPRLQERLFVLNPLVEVGGRDLIHPTLSTIDSAITMGNLLDGILNTANHRDSNDDDFGVRLIPLPRGRFLLFDRTLIMGILNVTPDSFSDGGKWTNVDRAVEHAMEMIAEGADIIDIGGESTRPGAPEISVGEQIRRTIPVIEAIRNSELNGEHIVISIDTRHAAVARAAVEAGADIVNDVSGGTFDPEMLRTVSELHVPIVLMHMRGTPESMQSLTDYDSEGGVVVAVAKALMEQSKAAEDAGIPRWMQILDPGIGFSKDMEGNLSLLKHYSELRSKLGDLPLLLGTSRKGFIGKICGEAVAEDRDFGTVGSCLVALCLGRGVDRGGMDGVSLGCNILRVHNVKAAKQAALVMDAIVKAH
jgi:dihydropteroate synthase/2-amino-4-hydroxy-6-hydroxymethyldihydropteridine diphosphokinase